MASFGKTMTVEHKGAIDLVTSVDRESEGLILETLGRAFPGYAVLTEESSPDWKEGEWVWIIDPLDGTTNYSKGFPFFCISIALARKGTAVAGAVFNPVLDEMFTAVRGGGAFLNRRKLRVSTTTELSEAFLATGFPYDIRESRRNNLDNFSHLVKRALAVRRAGSAALDLSYVAAARFDGFWELKLSPWDTAAAALLVEEAGGRVTTAGGRPWHMRSGDIAATNGRIHRELIRELRSAGRS
jgi:myo-inositol-1(or 4)-monophosphatase